MKFNFTPPHFSKWVAVSALALASFGACQKYDDSELWNKIANLETRNYVTDVTALPDGSGYTIEYANGESVTVQNVIKDVIVDESTHNFKIILADGSEIPLYYGDNPYIELDNTATTVPEEGQTVTIKVNASDDYSVSCEVNGSWVTYTNSGDTYTITIAPNKSSASRTAKVVFNCRGIIAEFNISQDGYPVSGTNPWDDKMETVFIKAGTFMMGSPETETDRSSNETQHQVTLTKDFYMGKYEVTNAQFCEFLNDKGIGSDGTYTTSDYGSQTLIYTNSWGVKYSDGKWAPQSGYDNYPVNDVTWYGANEYAKWIGGALPTEAQWEYACRAGSTNAYCFGDSSDSLGDYAWYEDNSGSKTHPVGQKKPNAWGLYDMHGNVWEWCADWYSDSYSTTAVTDPTGPTSGSIRVMHGGSWNSSASDCRSAFRGYNNPDSCYINFGFRVCFPVSSSIE